MMLRLQRLFRRRGHTLYGMTDAAFELTHDEDAAWASLQWRFVPPVLARVVTSLALGYLAGRLATALLTTQPMLPTSGAAFVSITVVAAIFVFVCIRNELKQEKRLYFASQRLRVAMRPEPEFSGEEFARRRSTGISRK